MGYVGRESYVTLGGQETLYARSWRICAECSPRGDKGAVRMVRVCKLVRGLSTDHYKNNSLILSVLVLMLNT